MRAVIGRRALRRASIGAQDEPGGDRARGGSSSARRDGRCSRSMTVEENLKLGAFAHHKQSDWLAPMDQVFELFPVLADRRRQLAGTLSGGEQQMLAVGRALMARPRCLLLDEPSLGLAPVVVERIFEVIQEIVASGVTVLLVEQNANLALSVLGPGVRARGGRGHARAAPGKELLPTTGSAPRIWERDMTADYIRPPEPRAQRLPQAAGRAPSTWREGPISSYRATRAESPPRCWCRCGTSKNCERSIGCADGRMFIGGMTTHAATGREPRDPRALRGAGRGLRLGGIRPHPSGGDGGRQSLHRRALGRRGLPSAPPRRGPWCCRSRDATRESAAAGLLHRTRADGARRRRAPAWDHGRTVCPTRLGFGIPQDQPARRRGHRAGERLGAASSWSEGVCARPRCWPWARWRPRRSVVDGTDRSGARAGRSTTALLDALADLAEAAACPITDVRASSGAIDAGWSRSSCARHSPKPGDARSRRGEGVWSA